MALVAQGNGGGGDIGGRGSDGPVANKSECSRDGARPSIILSNWPRKSRQKNVGTKSKPASHPCGYSCESCVPAAGIYVSDNAISPKRRRMAD
ncbi:hypothetical protein GWI33_009958 [Rhynchophorus ferrugineus]|uniref:Uncharacterized protein n=1 Tax=Rhynchophorus ferrugineus TaxID=354439 RepID=A0A834IXP6_RHYFE|nr:hypothetical protein GWI33_009958 [Rhynchophorus ferrugineus]